METICMNMENDESNYTYYTWKNVRQQYKNNKLKIMAPDG